MANMNPLLRDDAIALTVVTLALAAMLALAG
jgi:hypothetical protein